MKCHFQCLRVPWCHKITWRVFALASEGGSLDALTFRPSDWVVLSRWIKCSQWPSKTQLKDPVRTGCGFFFSPSYNKHKDFCGTEQGRRFREWISTSNQYGVAQDVQHKGCPLGFVPTLGKVVSQSRSVEIRPPAGKV